jgi:hypothetical protein
MAASSSARSRISAILPGIRQLFADLCAWPAQRQLHFPHAIHSGPERRDAPNRAPRQVNLGNGSDVGNRVGESR